MSHEHRHTRDHGSRHGATQKSDSHDHSQASGGHDWSERSTRLELEGEVTMPLLHEAIDAIVSRVAGSPDDIRLVLDLGSGPGVATVVLAQRFPRAAVTAVDASGPLLDVVPGRAARFGVERRVKTKRAALERSLDVVAAAGTADVVWASMVLHHVAALAGTLADIHRLLRPEGMIAVLEFGHRRASLPDGFDSGRDGFVDRLAQATQAALEEHLPPGAMALDWPALLTDAGFDLLDHRELALHLPAPLDDRVRRWVRQGLEIGSHTAGGTLDDGDRELLAALADVDDPRCVLYRDDLPLDISRTFLLARRS